MYAREVDGQVLTLAVSGLLWNSSLVMQDEETGTLWSHMLGKGMHGPMKGKRLRQIPSVMTDWQSWSEEQPDSTVAALSRSSIEYQREFYRDFEEFVIGLASGGQAKAWTFGWLDRNPTANDEIAGEPVLVAFDRENVTPRMYSRKLQSQVVTFELAEGKLTDRETGTTWNPITGKAISGPLVGTYLQAKPAIVSLRDAWMRFHPKSELRSLRP